MIFNPTIHGQLKYIDISNPIACFFHTNAYRSTLGFAGRPRLGVSGFFRDLYVAAHQSGMSKPKEDATLSRLFCLEYRRGQRQPPQRLLQ